jgi:alkylation response protein AidB-like acyl-CoA dehydrogenase
VRLSIVRQKASPHYRHLLREAKRVGGIPLQVAEAAMMVDTAHFHAYARGGDVDTAPCAAFIRICWTRARVRADTGYVVEKITQAIEKLLFAHGSAGFADASPLQRIWRDAAVASRHAVVLPPVGYELLGKALLGVENNITPLI